MPTAQAQAPDSENQEVPRGPQSRQVTAGRVGRAHGLDGSFYVAEPTSRLLVLDAQLSLAGRTSNIVRRAGTDARPIVRLEGIGSREQAQAVRGQPLLADLADAPSLGADEYWAVELEGCTVLDGPRTIGTVRRLVGLPSCEALEVALQDGRQLLIPMVREAIRSVDAQARRVEVDTRFLGES
jgi:16S rRNA processing protein RimM